MLLEAKFIFDHFYFWYFQASCFAYVEFVLMDILRTCSVRAVLFEVPLNIFGKHE